MTYTYKFLKHQFGVTFFASVSIDIVNRESPDSTGLLVTDFSQQGQVSEKKWWRAANHGVEDVLNQYEKNDLDLKKAVSIIDVIVSPVDSTIGTVQCAASFALWEALGNNVDDLSLEFDEDWHVVFPKKLIV